MLLFVYATPGVVVRDIAALLEQSGYAVMSSSSSLAYAAEMPIPVMDVGDKKQLLQQKTPTAVLVDDAQFPVAARTLATQNGTRLVGFFSRPEYALSTQGEEPAPGKEFLDQWHQGAGLLVDVARRYREHVLLLEEGDAQAFPGRFRNCLKERLGVPVPVSEDAEPQAVERKDSFDPLRMALASALTNQVPGIPSLQAELRARSVGLGSSQAGRCVDIEAAFLRLDELEVPQRARRLIELEVAQLRDELAIYHDRVKSLESNLADREAVLKNRNADLAEKNRICKELYKVKHKQDVKIDEQAASMHERDVIIAARGRQIEEIERAFRQERERAQTLQKEIHKLRTSISWKLTRPVRWIKRLLLPGYRVKVN